MDEEMRKRGRAPTGRKQVSPGVGAARGRKKLRVPRKKIVVKWFPMAPTGPAMSEPAAPPPGVPSAEPAGAPASAAAPPECDCAACKAACGCGAAADAGAEPQPTGAGDPMPTDGAVDGADAQESFEYAEQYEQPTPRTFVTSALEQATSEEEFTGLVDPIKAGFQAVVVSNIATSSLIAIPTGPRGWEARVVQYARTNKVDGAVLLAALARAPQFRRNGWFLKVQARISRVGAGMSPANAMTFDRLVCVRGPLPLGVYVHELVHVAQYGMLGPTAFLTSYFGLSAAAIAWRFARRQPISAMNSSPHEAHAYAVARRFDAWHLRTFGVSAYKLTV